MKKFIVTIIETLEKQIEIYADNVDQAYDVVKDNYDNEEYILDHENYINTDFHVLEVQNEDD